jgi:hypothetical protein
MVLSPSERTIRARLAAHEQHSRYSPHETTAAGQTAFRARFEKQVDPDGVLPVEERARRAQSALRAHMTRLAFYSARNRRMRKEARQGGAK